MDLEQRYKKETGYDVGKIHDTGCVYYLDHYVEWLQKLIKLKGKKYKAKVKTLEMVKEAVKYYLYYGKVYAFGCD